MSLKSGGKLVAAAGTIGFVVALSFAVYALRAGYAVFSVLLVVAAILNPVLLIASFVEPVRSSHPELRRALRASFLEFSLFTAAGFADEAEYQLLTWLSIAGAIATHFLLTRRFLRPLRQRALTAPQTRRWYALQLFGVIASVLIGGLAFWLISRTQGVHRIPLCPFLIIVLAIGSLAVHRIVHNQNQRKQ